MHSPFSLHGVPSDRGVCTSFPLKHQSSVQAFPSFAAPLELVPISQNPSLLHVAFMQA
jgi:hypothetical protein